MIENNFSRIFECYLVLQKDQLNYFNRYVGKRDGPQAFYFTNHEEHMLVLGTNTRAFECKELTQIDLINKVTTKLNNVQILKELEHVPKDIVNIHGSTVVYRTLENKHLIVIVYYFCKYFQVYGHGRKKTNKGYGDSCVDSSSNFKFVINVDTRLIL